MGIPLLVLTTLFALPCWTVYCIYANYQEALKIGLPIVIIPVDAFNPLWVLVRPYVSPFLSHLPFGLGNFTRYSYFAWAWKDGPAMHARHGSAFTIVTPAENQVYIADASAAEDIFIRRKDFLKLPVIYTALEVFGRHLVSADGETWQRHRKITTPPFNERNSDLVWTESLRQAREMLQVWVSKSDEGTIGTAEDTSLLALNVLASAGFGTSYSFDSELKAPVEGHRMSYRDALRIVMSHVFITILIGTAKVPSWLLPKKVAVVGEAVAEFKQYMVEMVGKERAAHARGDAASANLMSNFIRASEEAGRVEQKGGESKGGLTDDEIYGNLFIYNVAGHESTANALAYTIALLACYPQWQEWVGEELDRVFNQETDKEGIEQYAKIFPQLKRCLALLVCGQTSFPNARYCLC
jgi:cytochrome P450